MADGDIETLMRGFYDARVKGDIDAIRDCFAPNATFQVAGSDQASPMPTVQTGQDAVVGLMQGMISTFALTDFSIVEMIGDGDKAAIRWRADIHHIGTNTSFVSELADFVEVQEGKIVSFVEFLDTAMAVKVLGAK